jgi:hypothetical protein
MRVKIQYSVDLEDVPNQVEKLLPNSWEIEEIKGLIEDIEPGASPTAAMKTIDYIRKELFSLDNRLEDCYSILQGYVGVLSRGEEQPPEQPNLEDQLKALEGLKGLAAFENMTSPSGGNDDSVG